ncbi:YbhB/YbcL family Raf kinase inhibitor-like protein [Brackiella oedipodis]|uniref:YbhB/YbcL family Raf kinase inhibitor-like protein n=1 Tax=Brackiella oedipodis TaxID=124225 RepID=UPI00048BEE36|nr:YbhB/YbcL family Raf kinase inhibitor-like protein [Brackiella oedipodis]
MKLTSQSIQQGQAIDPKYAFAKQDPESHVALSDNISPQFSWSDLPEGTQSLVMICTDTDAPSVADDANREDKEVPADLERAEFYHWVLIDIPSSTQELAEGEFSKGVTPKGKQGPAAPNGLRQGLNNFTQWFANDQDMKGEYFAYDGPCPPFNDSLVHHYHFTLYALDIPKVNVEGSFDAPKVLEAIKSHVLAQDTITGTYTLNPRLS